MTWRHLCACKDDPRKSQTPGQPLEKRDGKGKGLNLKSIVGGCHEQGGLASNSKVIQTIDDGKGSKERNLIRRSLTHIRISPNLPEYKVDHLIYFDSHSSRVVKNISQKYSNLRLQRDIFYVPEKKLLPNMVGSGSMGRNRVQGDKSRSFDRSRHPVASDLGMSCTPS